MSNIETRGIGDNIGVDQAQIVTTRLALDYAETVSGVATILNTAREQPKVVDSDQTAVQLGAVIKQLRDLDKRVEAFRVAEKQPYLRAEQGVDTFFFDLRDKLAKRNKNDRAAKPGAADVLQNRIDAYQDQKRIAEQARLDAERREAQRLAAIEQARLRKLQEEAQEAERALARARSEASKLERAAEAAEAARKQAQAQAEADLAAIKAEEARLATLVKPAELVRVRGNDANGGGVTLTSAREGYAILTDRSLLDLNALKAYFTDAEIEKALRGYAKATGHVKQLAGAEIGFRQKGITR